MDMEWYEDGQRWHSEDFGRAHQGRVRALLADGCEPKPVFFAVGSSGHVPSSDEWWIYDGTLGAPRADTLCAACACGWRGTGRLALDWDRTENLRDDVDVHALREEWTSHLARVEARTVPLPEGLDDQLALLTDTLGRLADDAPLAAMKAAARLERLAHGVGHRAAYGLDVDDETSWETMATGLGTTVEEARARWRTYLLDR
ncbi:hypothetical protein [Streptomyces sp. NPDC006368]|uniref:hypothetical protein n=1 Tax=Streptomyces sp. NPDC006368 TaxID=3156760 RepID=UPI0033A98B79